MKSRKMSAVLVFAVFIGIVIGLVITTQFDLTGHSMAANEGEEESALGSQEPVNEELYALQDLSQAFSSVAENVKASVVTIKSTQVVSMDQPDVFRYFFGMPEERRRQGLGSGVIISKDGYIITNNHVVEDADELMVTIGKNEHQAEIVGRDPESDLAVIQIEANDLQPVKLGDSDKLKVGEWVLAVGNPFSELLDQTVTAGIVSAKGRSGLTRGQLSFEDFIQTDAAINPGNSGGALVNLRGELVGINTMIFSQSGGSVGIGFAIPINLARNVAEQLIETGEVSRGWLGVMIENLDEDLAQGFGYDGTEGVLVSQVVKDSPAEDAGLQSGDIILEVNGAETPNTSELMQKIAGISPGTTVNLTVWRGGDQETFRVKLGERPQNGQMQQRDQLESEENVLGLSVRNLTPQLAQQFGYENETGVVVARVKSGSVAARERIQPGDLIKTVNRKPVRDVSDFNAIMGNLQPDDVVLFRLKRGDTSFFAALRVPQKE